MDQIGQVRAKVGQLLGVLGRAGAVLGGHSILLLYNGLVLPLSDGVGGLSNENIKQI